LVTQEYALQISTFLDSFKPQDYTNGSLTKSIFRGMISEALLYDINSDLWQDTIASYPGD